MAITQEQKTTIVTASALFDAAAPQIKALAIKMSLLASLLSEKDLGGKNRKALLAIASDNEAALGESLEGGNDTLYRIYQVLDEVPAAVAMLGELVTQAEAIKTSLNITEPEEDATP